MKKKLRRPIQFGILISALTLMSSFASGTTFTAVASGNWSSIVTWGGTVPAITNISDQVNIPVGITVTMDNLVTLNGPTAQLSVLGTLSSSALNVLTVTSGIISGSGTITADSVYFGAATAFIFTGSLTANNITTVATSLQSAATILVYQKLTLLTGILSVQAGGTLTLAANSTIVVSGGTLALSGGTLGLASSYNVVYNTASAVAGMELSGAGMQNVTINVGPVNTVTLSTNLVVSGILTLTSGSLVLGTHNLTIAGNVAASGTGTITSTVASNLSMTSASSIAGTLTFVGAASGVNNLTLNIGSANQVSIAGTLNVGGILTLTTGVLNLSSAHLTISGNIAASGNGAISSTANSNIAVNTLSSPLGPLAFVTGSNSVDTFSVNIGGGGSVAVSTNLNVTGALVLTSGHINISNNTVTMGAGATIAGANSNAYVITGATGSLAIPVSATSLVSTTFPVGTTTAYFPATVLLNVGSLGGTVEIGVSPHVYALGTSGIDLSATQHVVDATWNVHSDIVASLNMNLQVMWATAAEVNGFARATSNISHYTAGNWELGTTGAAIAVAGGMFSSTRTNLTSLSPFAVFDQSTSTGVTEMNSTKEIEVYPNPSSENILINNIDVSSDVVNMDIIDVLGHTVGSYQLTDISNTISISKLPTGNYFLKIYNGKMNTVKQFTKI